MLKRRTVPEQGPYGQRPLTWVVLSLSFTATTVVQLFLAVSTAEWWPIPVAVALGAAAVWCGFAAGRAAERRR